MAPIALLLAVVLVVAGAGGTLSSAQVGAARGAPTRLHSVAGLEATLSITPTNEWVNFYSQDTTLQGQPIPVGSVVRAYSPRGVLCGEFTVQHTGWYGLMPVYRDDPNTPEDEGMLPGEKVSFTIDGLPALPLGPDDATWTTNGAVKQVNLAASTVVPTNEWVSFYGQDTLLEGEPVPVGAVVRAYNPRGILCGEFVVDHAGWYGAMPVYRDDPETPEDEGMLPGEEVAFTIGDIPARILGPDDAIWTFNGDLKQAELSASLDTVPPVLSDIAAGDITGSGATVTWNTDEPATSQVEYGLSPEYGMLTIFDPNRVTNHSVTLSGLTDSTIYHYRVLSIDAAANLAVSGDHSFTTVDTNPPDTWIVTGPSGTIATKTASFEWEGADNLSAPDSLLYSYHIDSESWSSYTPVTSTVYSDLADGGHTFYVRARDEAGNVDTSAASRSFVVDTTGPALQGIQAVSIHASGATIIWTTNEPADSQVEYGLTASYGMTTSLDTNLTTAHSVVITGLDLAVTYHYRVMSRDAMGNLSISGDQTFTTYDSAPPDTTILSGPAGAVPSTDVTFVWTGQDDVSPVVNLLYSYQMDDATWSSYSGNTSQAFAGLAQGPHTFRVRALDEAGNPDPTPATRTFSVDSLPPIISGVAPANITSSGATVTWYTDEPADSQVEYGPTAGYGLLSPVYPALLTSHGVALSGLNESSVYHYRVLSRDGVGNPALSADHTLYVWPTAPITPTSQWVNFYSQNSMLDGQLLPAGSVIAAYNPRGVQCGHFVVNQTGWYGLMPVYGDDPDTPEDEGMLPGEEVTFTIDDIEAGTGGPDDAIWTSSGALKQVNLSASSVTPTNEWVNFYSLNTVVDGQPVPVGILVEAFDPEGTKCGETTVGHAGWYGLLSCYRDDPETPQDEGAVPGDTIAFKVGGAWATAVGPETPEWTSNGDVREVDLVVNWLVAGLAASNDSPTWLGEPTTFTATVTAGSNVTYTWAFGDGDLGNGAVVTHTYPATGIYTAVVTASNDYNAITATTTVSVVLSSEITLSTGWNLVSWPLAPVTRNLTDTLASCTACDLVWAYDAWDDTDPWKQWPDDLPQADETMGLWLHVTEPLTLTILGWQPASPDIELREGWNLVGYPAQTTRPVAEALISIDGFYTRVQTFDPMDPADPWKLYDIAVPVYANDLALMEPGRGYWIYVTLPCTLIVEP